MWCIWCVCRFICVRYSLLVLNIVYLLYHMYTYALCIHMHCMYYTYSTLRTYLIYICNMYIPYPTLFSTLYYHYTTGMPECKFGLNDKLIMEKEGGASAAAVQSKTAGTINIYIYYILLLLLLFVYRCVLQVLISTISLSIAVYD